MNCNHFFIGQKADIVMEICVTEGGVSSHPIPLPHYNQRGDNGTVNNENAIVLCIYKMKLERTLLWLGI